MSDELKHDPELPYVVVTTGANGLNSRFKYRNEAETHVGSATWLKVVDTTPKPKIPEDAEFIFVDNGDQSVFARREGIINGEMHWLIPGGDYIMEAELVEDFIGDSEVTVLVRKEES